MRGVLPWGGAAALAAALVAGVVVAGEQEDFPHLEHRGLFPLCTGCHEGIPEGDPARAYPSPEQCAGCHDGVEEERVTWTGPDVRVTNLDFDHVAHQQVMGAEAAQLDCTGCHTAESAPRMAVELAVVGQCLDCHAHRAEAHLVDADCSTCHVPLAGTRFAAERYTDFPMPPDHSAPDFIERLHGLAAEQSIDACVVCHTRERCASCHVNAATVREIIAMPAAPADLEVPRFVADYPVPESHRRPDFLEMHGEEASAERCGACHTRDDCMSCHLPPGPEVVARLAAREEAVAPGVGVTMRTPPSHADPDFALDHGTVASVQACGACHTRDDCTSCHQAPLPRIVAGLASRRDVGAPGVGVARRAPASHASPSFETQHGAVAAADPASCSTCHVRTQCEACHGAPADDARGAGAALAAAPAGHFSPAPMRIAPDTGNAARRAAAEATVRQDQTPLRRSLRAEASFHPSDFMLRHASMAYGRRMECSNCHDARAFCADCHREAGMQAFGRLGPGFHDAEPLWLLRHGQGARQALESCASCHRQRDCLQCHSELGAFRVSPHGPDFDARRAQKRNAAACLLCHLGNPLDRG